MAGICEHVQYKPKLWLEKMEMFSNGEGGKKLEWREVKSERPVIQHNPALISHHTSFLFSLDLLIQTNVVKLSMHCLCLTGNLPAALPLAGKQDKIWIFFLFASSKNSWERTGSAPVVRSCPQCTHTLCKAGLTYNGYICMWGICFDLHTVMQSQPASEHGTHTHRVNKCCRTVGVDLLQAENFPHGLYIYIV